MSFNFEIIPLHQTTCDFFFQGRIIKQSKHYSLFLVRDPLAKFIARSSLFWRKYNSAWKRGCNLGVSLLNQARSARFKFYDSVCEYRDDFFFEFSPGWKLKEITVREEYSAVRIYTWRMIFAFIRVFFKKNFRQKNFFGGNFWLSKFFSAWLRPWKFFTSNFWHKNIF